MKCRAMQNSWLKAMLAAGIVLLAGGLIWAYGVGAGEGLPIRLAGFLCGLGGALAAIGGGCLLLNRIRGERRTRENALHMEDERGLTVAYKAQNAAAIAAVLAIVAIAVTALVRGDHLYMMMGSAACCLVALVKIIAWYAYDKTM
ncbi:MAG: hypothetical protein MR637_11090 [Clostridiales bacterium]|nr:hypothetical protein [Clostridiales bacterium]